MAGLRVSSVKTTTLHRESRNTVDHRCRTQVGRTAFFASLIMMVVSCALFAEGYTFKDGHFDFPEVIRLDLTEKQSRLLDKPSKQVRRIVLSRAQRAQILAKSGVKEAPTKLQIFQVKDLEGDCTCALFNFGIIIKGGRIEIPIDRVLSDAEAAQYD
jgi:hypothetical protein